MKIRSKQLALSVGQILLVSVVLFLFAYISSAKVVEYNLSVDRKTVNFTGQDREALAINDQIPGPTLYFTSAYIGQGNKVTAPDIPAPNLFKMMSMMVNMDMGSMAGSAGNDMAMDMKMDMDANMDMGQSKTMYHDMAGMKTVQD